MNPVVILNPLWVQISAISIVALRPHTQWSSLHTVEPTSFRVTSLPTILLPLPLYVIRYSN